MVPPRRRIPQRRNEADPLQCSGEEQGERLADGVRVHRPKDLAGYSNRLLFLVETRFPKAFYGLKKFAIRTMIRLNEMRNSAKPAA